MLVLTLQSAIFILVFVLVLAEGENNKMGFVFLQNIQFLNPNFCPLYSLIILF